jgi:uncharacterized Tic20 family protein
MNSSDLIPDQFSSDKSGIITAFAHASILLPGVGIFVPLLLWCFRKKYPDNVQKQALQALIFQLLQWIYIQLVVLLVMLGVFLAAFIFSASHLSPDAYSGRMLIAGLISIGVIVIAWIVYIFFGLIAAVVCITGRDFGYPILGRWMEKHIANNPANFVSRNDQPSKITTSNQEYEENLLIAAVAHGSILIPVIGFIVPFVLVLFDKDKPLPARFQDLQALIFQIFGQVVIFILCGCQMIMGASIAIPLAQFGQTGLAPTNEVVILGIWLLILLFMAINIFLLLFTPALATFGIIASVQVMRGRQFRYPILDNWLAKRMRM